MLTILFPALIAFLGQPSFTSGCGPSFGLAQANLCKPRGSSCLSSIDCCFGLYCNNIRKCDSGTACRPAGSSCTTTFDCCTGLTCSISKKCQ
jgi:hypothetical protein